MINFKVSAPGKLNLFGEHGTCDNHNGLMASIDLCTTAKFNQLPPSNTEIELKYPKINLNLKIPLQKFQNFYKRCTFDDTLIDQIHEFMFPKYTWENAYQRKNAQSLIYLLAYVTYKEKIDIEDVTPFQVDFETQLSYINTGETASIMVCFTTCFLHWSNLRRDDHHELNDDDRDKISMYSKSCDTIFDNCMFKSNVTVSTYGSMIRYYCKDSSQNVVLDNMPKMRVLMIVSTVDEDEEDEDEEDEDEEDEDEEDEKDVTKMKKYWKNCNPRMANSILDNITDISDTAFSVFKEICDMDKEAPTYEQDVSAQEKTLLPLIRMQQRLNNIFINFHIKMHLTCEIAQKYELHGKCADFVHGRNTYIWCPSGIDTSSMEKDIRSYGFDVNPIHLNCDGVRIE